MTICVCCTPVLDTRSANDHIEITSQSVEQMVDEVLALPDRTKIQLLAPIVYQRKGQHKKFLEMIQREGYVRISVDGGKSMMFLKRLNWKKIKTRHRHRD